MADSQSTAGSYVESKNMKKLFLLSPSVVISCANEESADFSLLYEELREAVKVYELDTGMSVSIEGVAKIARKLACKYKKAHLIVAGSCETDEDSSPSSYLLTEILPKGSRVDSDLIVSGSGFKLVSSFLDHSLMPFRRQASLTSSSGHCRYDISVEDAVRELKLAVDSAMASDHSSGGNRPVVWILRRPSVL